ncbi:MAG: GTPase HflX [Clostridia bacterium]|nr:GTPase HflX [Clostridia bacterium]
MNQRAVLVGLNTGSDPENDSSEASLAELERLADTAGLVCVATVLQSKHTYDSATFIGSGKVQEIALILEETEADCVVLDHELSGSQTKNLEAAWNCRVIDRTFLILDIFATRAKSREGKTQVELSQLRYLLPRLSGIGESLSRLGGGIGTRGPGETKLETDRRHIKRRIQSLSNELEKIEKNRETQRKQRMQETVVQAALVGYTNAGKSSLLNRLTNAGVLAEDRLFATLDPTVKRLTIDENEEILLVDTVGFVRKLPHHLVRAFRSTLEEVTVSDMILLVMDASDPNLEEQVRVTESLLRDLDAEQQPRVYIYNKCDLIESTDVLPRRENTVYLSCSTGAGIDDLMATLRRILPTKKRLMHLLFPYSDGQMLSRLHECAQIKSEEYTEKGTAVSAIVDAVDEKAFIPYEVEETE